MGNYLNKSNSNSSTASSGSDDDGPSSIAQALAIFAVFGLILSSFAAPVAAHSATGVQVDNTSYNSYDDEYSQSGWVNNLTYNDSETVSVRFSADGVDYTNASPQVVTGDAQVVNHSVINNGSTLEVEIQSDFASGVNETTQDVEVVATGLQVESDGSVGTFYYTDTNGTTYTDSFSYSVESSTSTTATGSVALGNISTYDNGSVDSVDIQIENSSGDLVVDESNVSDFDNFSKELDTGDYTYTLVADGYADATGSFSVTENNTTQISPEFGKMQVDYEFTIENNGSAVDSFDFAIYDGDSIGDNETAIVSTSVTSNDSNTVSTLNLDDGSQKVVEVTYTDADGNETTYTETITVDSSQAENGTVSQTVDVATSSDDGGFIGGVPSFDNPFSGLGDQLPDDPVVLVLTIIAGFVAAVGTIFTLLWVKNGLKFNNL
ncbi:hypothetical protein HZS55_12905 [Halosimplex rubrum]|uniref:Uncharacterized protein n=1 Tax=Halosimplex rubrum TaxID=869889 RepID=A0A7D5SR09_9EURY|nr:hypothetical protein [Halosimplex rubrum]QLH78147.1 hypothetical protein HZS55_12905 [Halosimplex rubrum]